MMIKISRYWRIVCYGLILSVLAVLGPTVNAAGSGDCDPDGLQESGAIYRLCMPEAGEWNGDLVIFAHGYVAFNEPVAITEDQLNLSDDLSLPEIANALGFAFATTSYQVNGLAIKPGLDDIVDLVNIFADTYGQPGRVYLTGASEGGIITALAMEQHPDIFDGGLAACGPVGNFQKQLNYWGDVRVIFDYFFPGLIPGEAVTIPQNVIDDWDAVYAPQIEAALRAEPDKLRQLMTVAQVPVHPTNEDENIEALMDLLWYNVFATNDGVAKLQGQPFENRFHYYRGSENDRHLNRSVPRFQADPAAFEEVKAHYQTSGAIGGPLVTLHTLGDPVIPYWHEPIYRLKIALAGQDANHSNIPALLRYGHCDFTAPQALIAFALLVIKVTGQPLDGVDQVLLTAADRAEYRELAETYGIPVEEVHRVYLPLMLR